MKSTILKPLFFTFILGAILLSVWKFEVSPFHDFSLRFDDVNFNMNEKKPNDSIVFIAIDEKSVNNVGRWPWDRAVVAEGLARLHEAKVVIFDMVFSEPTNDASDSSLGEAIAETNAICGFFLREHATQELTIDQQDSLADSEETEDLRAKKFEFPFADYLEVNVDLVREGCSLQAAFSTVRDADYLFRHYPIAFKYKELTYPSLGTQSLRLSLDKPIVKASEESVSIGTQEIFLDHKGFTRLNYYPEESYNVLSFYDLISDKIDPELLRDKYIILGITEAGVEDVRATPIGAVPGPLLHYTFLSNFLDDDLLVSYDNLAMLFALIFLLVPLLLHLVIKKIISRAVIYTIVTVLFIVLAKLLYIHLNIWLGTFYPLLFLLSSILLSEAYAFMNQEEESKFIQGAFSSYLSPILLDKLKDTPELLHLHGETKEMTIFFSDIRGFTSFSEVMTPEALVTLLNRYFTPMAHIVRENEGMLDKYIGDAIMAFFNAPIDVENHAKKACTAAIEMIEHLAILNVALQAEGTPAIEIGIGLNTDSVIVGNMGSDDRFNYTVIGNGVNLASRVEGLNKNYRTSILITENTYRQLDETYLCRKLEAVKVKGKHEAVVLYELLISNDRNKEVIQAFEEVQLLFESQDFIASAKAFKALSEKYDDPVSELFYEKSIENIERLENKEEIGVVAFTTK
jgi:adenylate cyclase